MSQDRHAPRIAFARRKGRAREGNAGVAKSDKARKGRGGKHGLSAVLERSPGHLLQRAAQLAADAYVREAGPNAITQRQYAVLAAVEAAEAPSQSDLVRLTGIDRSTLADMAARMIAKGLLDRERSAADARANVVRLSDGGRAALEAARPHVDSADARVLAVLSLGKRDAFLNALSKLTRAETKAVSAAETAGEGAADPPDGPKASKKARKQKKAKAAKAKPPFEPARLVAPE